MTPSTRVGQSIMELAAQTVIDVAANLMIDA
jgi:hypothetical protein